MALLEQDFNYLFQKEKYAKIIFAELNKQRDLNKALSIVLKRIQEFTDVEATAIRLLQDSDYPYFVFSGFPIAFIKRENSLVAIDKCGNKLLTPNKKEYRLECMCGKIIAGKFDSLLSFFTQSGSFWSNSTTELLASASEKERQSGSRNYCNYCGYESVALIPIISDDSCLGLLQLNDHRKNVFSLESIEFLENIGKQIGYSVQNNLEFRKLREASEKIKILNARLKTLADKDHLTGLHNRRSFMKILKFEKIRSNRTGKPFTLIMSDIDYFKEINDTYGHDVGDRILIEVSKELKKSVRRSDAISRWGGDEFLVLLPETSQSGGAELAEKLLNIFRRKVFKYSNKKINLTLSFGVFEYEKNKNIKEFLKSVDDLLLKAKETGRDKIVKIEN
jgi:diguanylate cyclase (GGDEF)-like protein